MKSAILAAALLLLAACAQSAPAVDTTAEFEAIHAVEAAQATAIGAKDLDGAVAPYAPDAVFAATGFPPATTPDAIRSMFQGILDDPNAALSITPERAEMAASGDMAFTTASYSFTVSDPNSHQPVTAQGTNVTVWRKQADGSWRIMADYNVDSPTQ